MCVRMSVYVYRPVSVSVCGSVSVYVCVCAPISVQGNECVCV